MKIMIAQQENDIVLILLLKVNDGFEVLYSYFIVYSFKFIWVGVISNFLSFSFKSLTLELNPLL